MIIFYGIKAMAWVNMCTHKSRCVVNLLRILLFMKIKLLKVLSSSIKPKTCTIAISTTFIYSLSFKTKSVEDWIFNHIQMIRFTFDGSCTIVSTLCYNPTLREVWGRHSHSRILGLMSPPGLPKTQNAIVGAKTPCIEAFFIPLERSWNLDVQNGFAWTIWASTTQVMVERRPESQTDSLTLDH